MRSNVNVSETVEITEINLLFAKAELSHVIDPAAIARAITHINEALEELHNLQRAVTNEESRLQTVDGRGGF